MLEAINMKSEMDYKRIKDVQKKELDKKMLEKLNRGKTTIHTVLLSKDGKINKITNLTRSILLVISPLSLIPIGWTRAWMLRAVYEDIGIVTEPICYSILQEGKSDSLQGISGQILANFY